MPKGRPKKAETNTFSDGQLSVTSTTPNALSYEQLQKAYDELKIEHDNLKKKYKTARKRMAEKGV